MSLKRFNPCGHSGLGKFCHRCFQADTLEKTENSKQFKTPAERKAEAARLRDVPRNNSTAAPVMG